MYFLNSGFQTLVKNSNKDYWRITLETCNYSDERKWLCDQWGRSWSWCHLSVAWSACLAWRDSSLGRDGSPARPAAAPLQSPPARRPALRRLGARGGGWWLVTTANTQACVVYSVCMYCAGVRARQQEQTAWQSKRKLWLRLLRDNTRSVQLQVSLSCVQLAMAEWLPGAARCWWRTPPRPACWTRTTWRWQRRAGAGGAAPAPQPAFTAYTVLWRPGVARAGEEVAGGKRRSWESIRDFAKILILLGVETLSSTWTQTCFRLLWLSIFMLHPSTKATYRNSVTRNQKKPKETVRDELTAGDLWRLNKTSQMFSENFSRKGKRLSHSVSDDKWRF